LKNVHQLAFRPSCRCAQAKDLNERKNILKPPRRQIAVSIQGRVSAHLMAFQDFFDWNTDDSSGADSSHALLGQRQPSGRSALLGRLKRVQKVMR